MLGKTMLEKIITNHSKDEIKPGNIVWIDIDVRTARDFAGANVVGHLEKHYPEGQRIADVGRTFFTFDCVVPANNVGYAVNQHIIRKFARKERIKVYDVNSGIGSHVAIEQGFAVPGCTLVGTDSHLNILGSIGAFGQGMGDQDIAFAFKAGKTWFEVPHSVKVNIKGEMARNSTSKDLTLALVKYFGSAGLLGLSSEFYGQSIDNLTLDGRITLTSMVTEMGGITGLIPPSKEVVDFCKKRSRFDFEPVYADEDATYQKIIEIDVAGLKPQIACPYSPENVKDVAEVAGTKVDSVIIGSCTNGRYSDIELAANMIRGKKVHERVMFKIVPATREIYGKMLKNSLLEIFYDAGVVVSHAACSTCASGQIGMTGEDEVQVTTGNRNFKGKLGEGQTYLASPATAVATAIAGEISVPEF
ncbi:MAG: aconitase/3-isopropylmalate dehydratase large subunit family protein [Promethearchaeota archaeon]